MTDSAVCRSAVAGRSLVVAMAASMLIMLGGAAASAAAAGTAERAGPELDAGAWILVDARDGDRLAARSPASRRSIASTTKLMTAYLALQELKLDEKLTVPPYAAAPAESVAGLVEGERLTVRDLITAMMLPSANDAAATIAVGVARSEEAFVDRMNEAAADLGLDGTSYANPIGLDEVGNHSTAADLAELALRLREDRRFRRIVSQPEATLESGSQPRQVITRNALLLADASVDGIKTGHTLDAGYVLVASAKREGVPLVSVVLGASSESGRDAASAELLDYGYSLYERRSPFERRAELATAEVRYEDEPLALVATRELAVPARDDQVLEAEIDAPAGVEGPIARGARLGTATVTLDGDPVGKVPLVAARAIAEPGLIEKVGGPIVVAAIALVAIVILLGVVLLLRRRTELKREAERSPEERMRSQQERTRKREDGGAAE